MVYWRSTSTFTVLLRVSQSHLKATPRAVTTAASSLHPSLTHPTSGPFRDEGDHDPDIDLITLRRRSKSDDPSRKTLEEGDHDHTNLDTASAPSSDSASGDLLAIGDSPQSATQKKPELVKTESKSSRLRSQLEGLTKAIDEFTPLRPSLNPKDKRRESPEMIENIRTSHVTKKERGLDPYLVSYLKSLHSETTTSMKDPDSHYPKRNQEDVDLDSLSPGDVRATYATRKRKLYSEKEDIEMKPIASISGEPAETPEHLIRAGLQHLKLPATGGKVVIPRTMLVRLIEQTVNLSGAAVSGDDVVIERYSPTWHRFARLLRTSDLHKISTLKRPDTSSPKSPLKSGMEQGQEMRKDPLPRTETATPDQPTPTKLDESQSIPRFTEREYVVLALDSRRKRVVSTRFRRLLDGSANLSPPSSESFLKVESLHRYLQPLNIIFIP